MVYLAAVVILMWLLLGACMAFMALRQRSLERELRRVQERLREEGEESA